MAYDVNTNEQKLYFVLSNEPNHPIIYASEYKYMIAFGDDAIWTLNDSPHRHENLWSDREESLYDFGSDIYRSLIDKIGEYVMKHSDNRCTTINLYGKVLHNNYYIHFRTVEDLAKHFKEKIVANLRGMTISPELKDEQPRIQFKLLCTGWNGSVYLHGKREGSGYFGVAWAMPLSLNVFSVAYKHAPGQTRSMLYNGLYRTLMYWDDGTYDDKHVLSLDLRYDDIFRKAAGFSGFGTVSLCNFCNEIVRIICDACANHESEISAMKDPHLGCWSSNDFRKLMNLKENETMNKNNETVSRIGVTRIVEDGPATIVFWADGTKTVLKKSKDDAYDPEKAVMYALLFKIFGDCNSHTEIIKAIKRMTEGIERKQLPEKKPAKKADAKKKPQKKAAKE